MCVRAVRQGFGDLGLMTDTRREKQMSVYITAVRGSVLCVKSSPKCNIMITAVN
jgi:hypothetical protein